MKQLALTICLLLTSLIGFSQGFVENIHQNAIEVNQDFSLDSIQYNAFKKYNLIMVGEMHGTQEPAKFVEGLAHLILENENTVSIGLEIPTDEMILFSKFPSDSTLRISKFFTKKNSDGRNGQAWFNLIKYCISDHRIKLFLLDNYNSMEIGVENRDSAMYLSIKKQLNDFPNSKIITLSGNIHNWLIPFKNKATMGYYCMLDSLAFKAGTICSINHVYSEGTMLNNTGNGLEFRTVEFQESVYSESTDYKNYLVFYNTAKPSQYNCTFYTRKVHYSAEINPNNK